MPHIFHSESGSLSLWGRKKNVQWFSMSSLLYNFNNPCIWIFVEFINRTSKWWWYFLVFKNWCWAGVLWAFFFLLHPIQMNAVAVGAFCWRFQLLKFSIIINEYQYFSICMTQGWIIIRMMNLAIWYFGKTLKPSINFIKMTLFVVRLRAAENYVESVLKIGSLDPQIYFFEQMDLFQLSVKFNTMKMYLRQ